MLLKNKILWLACALSLTVSPSWAFQLNFGFNRGGGSSILYEDLLHNLVLAPTGKTFDDTNVGSTATQVFTLSNTGNYQAEDLTVSVTGTGFSEQSRTCEANVFTLVSEADCTVTVEFAPDAAGAFTGALSYSAPNITEVSGALSGEGVSTGAWVTDAFTRTASTLGSNWALPTGAGNYLATNGTSAVYNGDGGQQYWSVNTFGADQCSSTTLETVAVLPMHLAVRMQSTAYGAYYLRTYADGSADIYTKDSIYGATSLVGTPTTGTLQVGDVYTLCAVGNVLTAYRNGVVQTNTPYTHTANTYPTGQPGLIINTSTGIASNWSGGDYAQRP